jgi:pimeloyl-ACP methyl ester carboxylesterase
MPEVIVEGVPIHYEVHGAGIPILFVHPPVLSSHVFAYQVATLAKECQIILFDLPGHGHSAPSIKTLTYEGVAEIIRAVLDACQVDRAFICGYSMGGTMTLDFMVRHPNRVLGGILIGGFSEVADWFLKSLMSIAAFFARPGLKPVLAFCIALGNADKVSSFIDMFRDGRQANPKDIHTLFEYGIHHRYTDKLHTIEHPVLLVYGQKDKRFQTYAQVLHARLPNAQFEYIPNVSHQIPTKKAPELNRCVLQFVRHHVHEDRPALESTHT